MAKVFKTSKVDFFMILSYQKNHSHKLTDVC